MEIAPLRHKHIDELPLWIDRAQVLECVGVLPETADVRTFSFQTPSDSWFRYAPGQFVTLELPTDQGTILRIPVLMQVVLGSATMPVANLMKLGRGAVVPLDHRVGEPVDVMVNGRVIARGEIVIVEEDNSRFGISLTEVVGPSGSDQNG